jgi:hypothetical protein
MRFLLCSLMLTACSFQLGTSTNGDSGHAKFEYGSCLFGCTVDQPMMNGTTESIRVVASVIPPVTVRSTDSTVFSVGEATRECCPAQGACQVLDASTACANGDSVSFNVPIIATGPGSAELVLDQGDGTRFDGVSLTVAQPKSLVVSCGNAGSVTLVNSTSCALSWTARDASGTALMSTPRSCRGRASR